MNAHASPSIEFHGDASLGDFLDALEPYADESLVLEYGGRTVQTGYHVTEVKAGAFVALDLRRQSRLMARDDFTGGRPTLN